MRVRGDCPAAFRACAPEDDFRFIDAIAQVFGRYQAGRRAHRAIHVGRTPTEPADDVMVIVVDAVLVQGRRSRGLNAPDKPPFDQNSKRGVDGLLRDCADVGPNVSDDVVRRSVGPGRHGAQHRHALGGDLQATLAETLHWIAHDKSVGQFLERVKSSIGSELDRPMGGSRRKPIGPRAGDRRIDHLGGNRGRDWTSRARGSYAMLRVPENRIVSPVKHWPRSAALTQRRCQHRKRNARRSDSWLR